MIYLADRPIFQHVKRLMSGEIKSLDETGRRAIIQHLCEDLKIPGVLDPFRWERTEDWLWRLVPTKGFANFFSAKFEISTKVKQSLKGSKWKTTVKAWRGRRSEEASVFLPHTATEQELAGAETKARVKAVLLFLGLGGMWFEESRDWRSQRVRAAFEAARVEVRTLLAELPADQYPEFEKRCIEKGVPPEAHYPSWVAKAKPEQLPLIQRALLETLGKTRADLLKTRVRAKAMKIEERETRVVLDKEKAETLEVPQ